jgi:hypothetical protein
VEKIAMEEKSFIMLNHYFLSSAMTIFKELENKYGFLVEASDDIICYRSKNISFNVYFERNFEILIYFIFDNNKYIYLSSVASYLGLEQDYNREITQNQVSNENGIDFVLSNHLKLLKVILPAIRSDSTILAQSHILQKEHEKQELEEYEKNQILQRMDSAWKQKNYALYVELFQSAKSLVLNELYKKRFEYSLEHLFL